MVKFALIGVAALCLAGCSSKNVDSLEAVRQGVIKDIAKNVNVGAMDVTVVSVSFRDKEADAVVSFAPKGGTPQQGLTMNYTMERQGSEWHIKKRSQGDVQRHAGQGGGGGAMGGGMEGAAPMGGGGGSGQLPAGHPPLSGGEAQPMPGGGGPQQLPPGHPPLNGGGTQPASPIHQQ